MGASSSDFAKFFLHQVKVFSASPPVGEKTQQCVSVMAARLLPHLDNDNNNNNKTLTITITLNNNTESPASPACQGASQTGSCTHGRCSSGPPGDRWWDWFVFFKYKYKKVFKLPQLSAQRSSEVSRRWFRVPPSPQTVPRHKTQMARPEWKLKIDISQEW